MSNDMISVGEALGRILGLLNQMPSEDVSLLQAHRRILKKTLQARITQPPFAASAMDGYAIDSQNGHIGSKFKVIGESAAGHGFTGSIKTGECVRIFTGAPVPLGADCVAIQENVTRDGDTITLKEAVESLTFVRAAGQDFHIGDEILETGAGVRPEDIQLLATANIASIPVYRKPKIALMATGDELIEPGEFPQDAQIICSNTYGLAALLEAEGAEAIILPIARDNKESMLASLKMAEGADMLVTLGGASVGDHDLVRSVLSDEGLTLDFYKVAMRPGKPLMAGTINNMPMIGLPGNPVSAMVCGHIFLRPAIRFMMGKPPARIPADAIPLGVDMAANGAREHYMRAVVRNGKCYPYLTQDSARTKLLAQADVLAVRGANAPAAKEGDIIDVIRL